MVALLGHSHEETGSNRSAIPKGARQSSTLLANARVVQGRNNEPPWPRAMRGRPQDRT
jgi:hypothetical protein